MRILFAGTPATAVPPLLRLHQDHEVAAVLTRPPAKVGRKRVLTPSPVHGAATSLGLEVLTPDTLKDPQIAQRIAAYDVDAVAVVAYSHLIPAPLLDVPAHGWINLHYSLLPRWRGAAPVQYAIWNGDDTTGVSTFRIDAGLDTGALIDTAHTRIGPSETAGQLLERLTDIGSEVLAASMASLEAGTATLRPQEGEPTFAPKITTEDARLDLGADSQALARQTRALAPAPGTWAMLGDARIKIGPATATEGAFAPGEIITGSDVILGTGDGGLVLDRIAPPGKSWMAAADWARGLREKVVLT